MFFTALAANYTKLALMSQFELSLPVTLQYSRNDRITHEIQSYYFDKLYNNGTREDFLKNFTTLFGDRHFYQPISRSAKLYSKHAPLYLYYFNYSSFHSMEHFISDRETKYLHPILSLLLNHTWRVIQEFIFGIPVHGKGMKKCVGPYFLVIRILCNILTLYLLQQVHVMEVNCHFYSTTLGHLHSTPSYQRGIQKCQKILLLCGYPLHALGNGHLYIS